MRCWCDWIRRFDAGNWGSEVVRVRPCGVPWWTSGGGLVGSGPVPGGLALSAKRLSAHGLSLPYESFSVSRYFGFGMA